MQLSDTQIIGWLVLLIYTMLLIMRDCTAQSRLFANDGVVSLSIYIPLWILQK